MITRFSLHPVIEVALVAIAVSPVPPLLPGKDAETRGSKQFTYGLLAAVSVVSVIVIPMTFRILQAVFNREANISQSYILKTVVVGLVLPFWAGMLVQQLAPSLAALYAVAIGTIGRVLLIIAFLSLLLPLLPTIWTLIGNGTIVAIVAFTVVGLIAGHLLGGPDPRERIVLAIANVSRHPATSIALASANVGRAESKLAVAAILLYLIVSSVVVATYVHWVSASIIQGEEVAAL